MAKSKFIKIRTDEAGQEFARQVAQASGKDLTEFLWSALMRAGKRHEIKREEAKKDGTP